MHSCKALTFRMSGEQIRRLQVSGVSKGWVDRSGWDHPGGDTPRKVWNFWRLNLQRTLDKRSLIRQRGWE